MWLILGAVLVGAAAAGSIMSDVEQANYQIVEKHDTIELRDYAPMIVAEAQVTGDRKQAINQGFEIIADYIFGNNTTNAKVSMTAPVLQQSSEKIAMTAPVLQQPAGDRWIVRFVMPANYTMETLPKPNNDAVTLKEIPGKRFAAIRFSGLADEQSLKQQTARLLDFLQANQLRPLTQPSYAFFNPPWTLPPLRRNEVMVEIGR